MICTAAEKNLVLENVYFLHIYSLFHGVCVNFLNFKLKKIYLK